MGSSNNNNSSICTNLSNKSSSHSINNLSRLSDVKHRSKRRLRTKRAQPTANQHTVLLPRRPFARPRLLSSSSSLNLRRLGSSCTISLRTARISNQLLGRVPPQM